MHKNILTFRWPLSTLDGIGGAGIGAPQIRDSRFRIKYTGYWIRDRGQRTQDTGTTSCLSLRVNLASWLGKVSLRRNQIIHTSGEKFLAGNET